jgi:UDP-GlcNAc:undecaprenyl-phosphate GlcNAc-1-phosphate transferase
MGDAGSLCLGFSLAFLALALTQGVDSSISPVVPLLVLAVPITDTIIVMVKRIMQGKSPFKADKYHLHHIFLRYGMGRTQAVQTILAISIVLGGLSLLAPIYGIGDNVLFSLYAIYFLVYISASFYIIGVFRYTVRLRKKRQHLARSDMFSRFLFGSFDRFKIYRKAKRYNVNIPMRCTIDGTDVDLRGLILNISLTGCMLKMPTFTTDTKFVTLSYKMNYGDKLVDFSLDAEHLWAAEQGGAHYHGLRFTELSDEKTEKLKHYLTDVASQKKSLSPKHITA